MRRAGTAWGWARASGLAVWMAAAGLVSPPVSARTAPHAGPAENIAWIWPGAQAPSTGFNQAAAVVETLVLQGRGVQRSPCGRLPHGVTRNRAAGPEDLEVGRWASRKTT